MLVQEVTRLVGSARRALRAKNIDELADLFLQKLNAV